MLLALALLLALPPQGITGCRKCDKTGTIPCENHTDEIHELEQDVLFCSVAAACESCSGALLVDCPRCEGGPTSERIAARPALVAEWMQPTPVEAFLERSVPRFETERFELIIETGTRRNGRKKVDEHTLGHWIARDLQKTTALVEEHYDAGSEDYDTKMRMWIWQDPKVHQSVMVEFLHTSSTGDFAILGRNPMFAVWTESPQFDTAPKIRSLFVHHAGHLLTSNMLVPLWVGDIGGGWLDGAVGHWYEYAAFERTTNYCIEEATVLTSFGKNGEWRAAIRKQLSKVDERQLPRLITMLVGAMSAGDQALCWSFYDYLVATHRDAMRTILGDLKRKRPTREIFAEHLELSVFEAEAAWREWVTKVYPTQGDKPRSASR
jgi:hypothetical protein